MTSLFYEELTGSMSHPKPLIHLDGLNLIGGDEDHVTEAALFLL